jgi:hypothetical protein
VALDVSFALATRLGGDVVGAHLRPHRSTDKGYKPARLTLFSSLSDQALDALSKKHSAAGVKSAQRLFAAAAQAHDFTAAKQARAGDVRAAIWHELVGAPDKLMAIHGPVSDLTVVSRPQTKGQGLAYSFVLEALMRSGKPVLVLPQKHAKVPGKHIVVAWNQSPEVSRTVSACMPLLAAAESVTIVACGPENRLGPRSGQLVSYLKHYGVSATALRTKGANEQQEMLDACKDVNADLLVMGAYSRSRLRELVLGGMTEHMLWNASIPVIMQHS